MVVVAEVEDWGSLHEQVECIFPFNKEFSNLGIMVRTRGGCRRCGEDVNRQKCLRRHSESFDSAVRRLERTGRKNKIYKIQYKIFVPVRGSA